MKVFITKYALSQGILELEPIKPPAFGGVFVKLPGATIESHFHGTDWRDL
jgi:hypothetical protein